jgi:hypothetical protein
LQELRELARTHSALEGPAQASAAGALLCAAGDLLRRSRSVNASATEIDSALRELPSAAVQGWLASVDVAACGRALDRAATEAVEGALAETPDEREMWSTSAADALIERDRVESARSGLQRWFELGGTLVAAATHLRDAFVSDLADLDRARRSKARWLVPLNPRRRLERDLLDPEHRDQAWWFSSRAGCDDLVSVLGGAPPKGRHVHDCSECKDDLMRARTIDAPPPWHVASDDRMRLDLGLLTQAEQSRLESHTARCRECAEALRVSEEIDRAIAQDDGID